MSGDECPTIVLLSGGIDSTVLLAHLHQRGSRLRCLFVDYGHEARVPESQAATAIASHYGLPLTTISIRGLPEYGPGEVPGRNALLCWLATLASSSESGGLIALGIHQTVRYPDTGPAFLDSIQHTLSICSGGSLRLIAPFLHWDRPSILKLSEELVVPLEETYSCERGAIPPCGSCSSCKDLRCSQELDA